MNQKEKTNYAFGLGCNIALIVIGAFLTIGGIYVTVASTYFTSGAGYYISIGLSFLIIAIGFLVTGILNTITLSKKRTNKFLDNYQGFVNLVFNGALIILFALVGLICILSQTEFEQAQGTGILAYGIVVLPFAIASLVLILLVCKKSILDKTKKLFVIIASFLSIVPTITLMVMFPSILYIFVFFIFMLIEIAMAVNLIIDITLFKETPAVVVEVVEKKKETKEETK